MRDIYVFILFRCRLTVYNNDKQMQAAGSPPEDLVGDMPSAQDALNPDESCNPQ